MMNNWFFKNLWAIYLGGILNIVDCNLGTWQWWVIVIPLIVFVQLSEKIRYGKIKT